ncbi:MAG: hypothetical protein ABGY42_09210, partial [bacterium]
GPQHRRLRNLVQRAFTPTAMLKLEGRAEVITAELLDSIDGAGELDLTQNWSLPIPVRMIGEKCDAATVNRFVLPTAALGWLALALYYSRSRAALVASVSSKARWRAPCAMR